MDYSQTLEFLFTRLQSFHNAGAVAYKPGLDRALALSEAFGNPHRNLKVIHVGGTNGKGSTAHTLAAILRSAGYRTGLYTSPHLVDFRERIRIDGKPIPESEVIDFVSRFIEKDIPLDPSFFELTTIMAFEHFARNNVDYAVVEVGLGGRLDTTNIVSPVASVITNISFDHTALLGNTLPEIAAEKAGIIKPSVPVVIGEAEGDVRRVFADTAAERNAPVFFADENTELLSVTPGNEFNIYHTASFGDVRGELTGDCQWLNARTVLTAVSVLRGLGIEISTEAVRSGFARVTGLTGLMGRWMKVSECPEMVCDTGHNPGGWQYLGPRLKTIAGVRTLHVVIGFVNDKDITHILDFMPRNAVYYFVQPSVDRAAGSSDVASKAAAVGLAGESYPSVMAGVEAAKKAASPSDFIFVGGSTFVVADLLSAMG